MFGEDQNEDRVLSLESRDASQSAQVKIIVDSAGRQSGKARLSSRVCTAVK